MAARGRRRRAGLAEEAGKEGGKPEESPEERYRKELPLVASVESGQIKGNTIKEAVEAATDWLRKNGGTQIISRKEGEIVLDGRGLRDSISHRFSQDKLDDVPAVAPVLQKGAYLGRLEDKNGKPIMNYYFASRVNIGNSEKIVFVRVREKEEGKKRFNVHEVFTDDQIKKVSRNLRATDPNQSFRNAADFYKNLIAKYLAVKEKEQPAEEPVVAPVEVEENPLDFGGAVDKDRISNH